MKLAIVTIAYNQPAGLRRMVHTIQTSHEVKLFLFRHSNIPEVTAACEQVAQEYLTKYHPYGINRGVARSWNDGILGAIKWKADVVMLVNDDIWFEKGDVDKIVDTAVNNRDRYMVQAGGYHHYLRRRFEGHGMACCALNPIAIDKVGMFDVNFAVAYNEDSDYAYRAKLLGLQDIYTPGTNVHHAGSQSIFTSPQLMMQNRRTHQLNNEYYIRKYGGCIGSEVYKTPFNGKFGLKIEPENRNAPYPGHNRTDLDTPWI